MCGTILGDNKRINISLVERDSNLPVLLTYNGSREGEKRQTVPGGGVLRSESVDGWVETISRWERFRQTENVLWEFSSSRSMRGLISNHWLPSYTLTSLQRWDSWETTSSLDFFCPCGTRKPHTTSLQTYKGSRTVLPYSLRCLRTF